MSMIGAVHRHKQGGFSMIEVLVTLVILALGLLAFALLQVMNLKFSQSANYRTQATNLANDLLDQMRANRLQVAQYSAITPTSFGTETGQNCSRPLDDLTPAESIARWKCQVRASLGPKAVANVDITGANDVTITVNWADAGNEVGEYDPDDEKYGQIVIGTKL